MCRSSIYDGAYLLQWVNTALVSRGTISSDMGNMEVYLPWLGKNNRGGTRPAR